MTDRQKYSNFVKHIYIPITKKYKSNKGLSEKIIKKRLVKSGWEVWRAGFIHVIRYKDLYPNVFNKYIKLVSLLGKKLEYLQYLSAVHHGMPDFLCYKKEFVFVECKFGHEQLSEIQKKCIIKLRELGFVVQVHKFVFDCTKLRVAYVDILNNDKIVIQRQERLRLRY